MSRPVAMVSRQETQRRESQADAVKILARPPHGVTAGWLEVARERAKDHTSTWDEIASRLGLPKQTVMSRWSRVRHAAGLLPPPAPREGQPRLLRPSGLVASCEGYSPSAGVADWRAAS